MADCARCFKPIEAGQRSVVDPCCGAPDCDTLADVSHFECLPVALKRVEDEA
jgi:hypothetical protein